jgi:hypothetical protein
MRGEPSFYGQVLVGSVVIADVVVVDQIQLAWDNGA